MLTIPAGETNQLLYQIKLMDFVAFPEEIGRKDRIERTKTTFVFGVCLGFAGDNAVETNQGLYLVYMHAGTNPFEVINQAVK